MALVLERGKQDPRRRDSPVNSAGARDYQPGADLLGQVHDALIKHNSRPFALVEQTQSSWIQMAMRFARAQLADDAEADMVFQEALTADMTMWPFQRGRLLLAHGAWLRRRRRVSESRSPLRSARDTFDALGAVQWAERARQELRAAGETSRRREPEAWDNLSAQEIQIATMASEGLSNREIGRKLYLSHRTVGSHLYRTFPKLGITSRVQLASALARG